MLGAIGDTLLACAIFQDLRRAFPSVRMLAFVSHANRGTVDLLSGPDEVIVVSATRLVPTLRTLRRHRVDVFIDIGQWARISSLLTGLSGARFTIGFKTPGQYRHYTFDATVEHSNRRHEIDNFRALLAPLGIAALGVPSLRTDVLSELPMQETRRTIVFHPWAAGYQSHLREWPEERWAAVGSVLLARGYDIAITGGPADQARAELLASAIGEAGVRVMAGKASLRETAIMLSGAAGVLSVNTGIMHLAAVVNAPLISLHGPTNPVRWGPLSDNSVVLGPGPEEGGAFLNLGFEYPPSPSDCMGKITVDAVLGAFEKLHILPVSVGDDSDSR